MPSADPLIAFDVTKHEAAGTEPAAKVLARFKADVSEYARQANTQAIAKLGELTDTTILDFFNGKPAAETILKNGFTKAQQLKTKLHGLRESDETMLRDAIPLLDRAANYVPFSTNDTPEVRKEKIRFILSRHSGQSASVWTELLFGISLSSKGSSDLLRLNPFLTADTLDLVFNLVSMTMLRANRLGHTSRCIDTLINLLGLLDKVSFEIE
jgi:hypothetical protein